MNILKAHTWKKQDYPLQSKKSQYRQVRDELAMSTLYK